MARVIEPVVGVELLDICDWEVVLSVESVDVEGTFGMGDIVDSELTVLVNEELVDSVEGGRVLVTVCVEFVESPRRVCVVVIT